MPELTPEEVVKDFEAEEIGIATAKRNVTPIVAFALEDGRRRFRIHAQHCGDLIATFSTGRELGEFWDAFGIERERWAAKAAETDPGFDRHRQALNAKPPPQAPETPPETGGDRPVTAIGD